MGYRTVIMLNNDYLHQWSNDPELGKKIIYSPTYSNKIGNYGRVVECTHADNQTLAMLDHYDGFNALSYGAWKRGQDNNDVNLKLIKEAARILGYRLVKNKSS